MDKTEAKDAEIPEHRKTTTEEAWSTPLQWSSFLDYYIFESFILFVVLSILFYYLFAFKSLNIHVFNKKYSIQTLHLYFIVHLTVISFFTIAIMHHDFSVRNHAILYKYTY